MMSFIGRPAMLSVLVAVSFTVALVAKAPASLVVSLCSALSIECVPTSVTGSLYAGRMTDVSFRTQGNEVSLSSVEWSLSLSDYLSGRPWLAISARDGANFASATVDLSTTELAVEKLAASWRLAGAGAGVVRAPIDLTAAIERVVLDTRSHKVLELDGRVSVESLNLEIQSASLNVGTVEAFLQASEGRVLATPSNEYGDFALTGECGISFAGYDCGLRVDASSSPEDVARMLAMASTEKNADSIYSYDFAGAWQ